MFLIWSNEHKSWWSPNENGYTENVLMAGLYAETAMRRICSGATLDWTKAPNEIPVRIDDLPTHVKLLFKESEITF